jgi:4-hydroxybenzoate polyprenyltransferase
MRLTLGIRHWADDPGIRGRLYQYALLMRLHKPIGIFLLLWPTLWSLWMASDGKPDALVLTVFVPGVILMRSAGCIINDYADRHIDPHVERTRERPLAAGLVTEREALSLFVVLCLVAFGLVLFMNRLTIMLSFIAVLIAAAYPFMKRYTYLPQVILGAAFAMAVPMAWAAQSDELPRAVWLLFTATVLWTTAYDTMYAIVDRDPVRRHGPPDHRYPAVAGPAGIGHGRRGRGPGRLVLWRPVAGGGAGRLPAVPDP